MKHLLLIGHRDQSQPKASGWMFEQNTLNSASHPFRGMNVDTLRLHRIGRANFNKGEETGMNETQKTTVEVTGAVSVNGTNTSENTLNKLICHVCGHSLTRAVFWIMMLLYKLSTHRWWLTLQTD